MIFEFLSTRNIKTEELILDSILRHAHLSDTYELLFQRLMQVIQKVLHILMPAEIRTIPSVIPAWRRRAGDISRCENSPDTARR